LNEYYAILHDSKKDAMVKLIEPLHGALAKDHVVTNVRPDQIGQAMISFLEDASTDSGDGARAVTADDFDD
jgi:hypothetical protein